MTCLCGSMNWHLERRENPLFGQARGKPEGDAPQMPRFLRVWRCAGCGSIWGSALAVTWWTEGWPMLPWQWGHSIMPMWASWVPELANPLWSLVGRR